MIGLQHLFLRSRGKLPVVKGAKSLFANEATAMYVTDTKVAGAAEATRKLLLNTGWEPFGANSNPPENEMLTFKRNAVQVSAFIGVAPAQGGKTSIMLSTLQLSADTDDGLFEFQPQVRLQIDSSDAVKQMHLWADNTSVSSNADITGDVVIEDGRARGAAKLTKPGEFFGKAYTFEDTFDVEVMPLPEAKGE